MMAPTTPAGTPKRSSAWRSARACSMRQLRARARLSERRKPRYSDLCSVESSANGRPRNDSIRGSLNAARTVIGSMPSAISRRCRRYQLGSNGRSTAAAADAMSSIHPATSHIRMGAL
jgi:hypothetical protein